jgi:hypothetical protein
MIFCMNVDHKFCMKHTLVLIITNFTMVENCKVICANLTLQKSTPVIIMHING